MTGSLAYAYAAAVGVWSLLRLSPASAWTPFEVADLLGWVLYVPLPVFVAAAAVRRRWTALGALLVPLAALAVDYGPQLTPNRVPDGRRLRIVSANLYRNEALPVEVAGALYASKPDIIAVQELGTQTARTLSSSYRSELPYRALFPSSEDPTWGMGIYSRFPLRQVQAARMAPESCRCQIVEVRFAERWVTLVNVHLLRPGLTRRFFDTQRQEPSLDALLRSVETFSDPYLVVGDLNVPDRHRFYRRLRQRLGDAHRDAGWGLGFTWGTDPRWKLLRIDYVLHSAEWGTRSFEVAAVPRSDHRSVAAELVLLEE